MHHRLTVERETEINKAIRVAEGVRRLRGEEAMEVFAEAATMQAQGRDIVHQEIGEPDFATPQHIVEAGIRALQAGHAHCCPAPGVPERREATAAHVVATRNIQAQPEQLVVTSGTLEKMAAALQPLWARP